MPYLNGTAADHVDLLLQLRNFVITAGWEELLWDGTSLNLKGTGDNGNDEIYVGFDLYVNSASNIYNLRLVGAMGYRPGYPLLGYAPNRGAVKNMAVWNNAMPFTFVADGRRIIVIVSITGSMYCCYAGFLRPIATEQQEPYPLFIAGTTQTERSHTSTLHWSPWGTQLEALDARSVWRPGGFLNDEEISGTDIWVHPWQDDNWGSGMTENFGGGLTLRPSLVYDTHSSVNSAFAYQTYGHMDGIFRVDGLNQIGGSTLVIGADTYLLVTNGTGHADWNDFAAIRLT